MVTYGAMSQQPLSVPPGLLIFSDIRLRGFWLTGGYAKARRGAASQGRPLQLPAALQCCCSARAVPPLSGGSAQPPGWLARARGPLLTLLLTRGPPYRPATRL